jgi:type IV secretion system protein VirB9
VTYDPAQSVRLVAAPDSSLTVMLLPGDRIEQVALTDHSAFDVRITGSFDSVNIVPLRPDAAATLVLETGQRRYEFDLQTSQVLMAAYVVRFTDGATDQHPLARGGDTRPASIEYRLSGEQALRPSRLDDDGRRTFIQWSVDQSLPAVFGIGATGEEEVVEGYMRGDVFTIERVYGELIFRIDKKRAKARRLQTRNGR